MGPISAHLLSSKDQPLLIRWNTLLVLDLGLDILDGVGGLNLECDGLTGQCLDKNLHDRSLKTLCLFDPPTNMAFEMLIRRVRIILSIEMLNTFVTKKL